MKINKSIGSLMNQFIRHLLIILIFCNFLFAAEESRGFWIGAGIGLSMESGLKGITEGSGDFNFRLYNFLLQARVLNFVGRPLNDDYDPYGQILDAGLLIGYVKDLNSLLRISITSGLSFIYVTKKTIIPNHTVTYGGRGTFPEFKTDTYRTVGLPVDFQFYFVPFKHLGVSFSVPMNFNKPRSYIGCAVMAKFGILKKNGIGILYF